MALALGAGAGRHRLFLGAMGAQDEQPDRKRDHEDRYEDILCGHGTLAGTASWV